MNLKIKEIPLTIRDLEVIEDKLYILRSDIENEQMLERIDVIIDKVRDEILILRKVTKNEN